MDGPQKGRFLYNAEEYLPANKALYQSKLDTGLKVTPLPSPLSSFSLLATLIYLSIYLTLLPPTYVQEWVLERYEGAPVELVGAHRKYLELETSAADHEGQPFLTPTVIHRWAH